MKRNNLYITTFETIFNLRLYDFCNRFYVLALPKLRSFISLLLIVGFLADPSYCYYNPDSHECEDCPDLKNCPKRGKRSRSAAKKQKPTRETIIIVLKRVA